MLLDALPTVISRDDTYDWLALIGLILAVGGSLFGIVRAARPVVQQRIEDRIALRELVHGKPAEPPNPISGMPGQPAIPGIGPTVMGLRDEMARLADAVQQTADTRKELNRTRDELADTRTDVHELQRRVGVLEDRAGLSVTAEATPNGGVAIGLTTSPTAPTQE